MPRTPITTEEENRTALERLCELTNKGEPNWSEEEARAFYDLADAVEVFETQAYGSK